MKGITSKAFMVTLLLSQLPMAAMQPAVNAARQALAQYAPLAQQAVSKVGQRVAQNPELVSRPVAALVGLAPVAALAQVAGKTSVQEAVAQVVKQPWYKELAKAGCAKVVNGAVLIKNTHSNKWVLIGEAAVVADAIADYFGYGVIAGAKKVYNYLANLSREATAREEQAREDDEVRKLVASEHGKQVQPGIVTRALDNTKAGLRTAADYTVIPLWNNKGKTAAGLGTVGLAGAGYHFRSGLNRNVLQPVMSKLSSVNVSSLKNINVKPVLTAAKNHKGMIAAGVGAVAAAGAVYRFRNFLNTNVVQPVVSRVSGLFSKKATASSAEQVTPAAQVSEPVETTQQLKSNGVLAALEQLADVATVIKEQAATDEGKMVIAQDNIRVILSDAYRIARSLLSERLNNLGNRPGSRLACMMLIDQLGVDAAGFDADVLDNAQRCEASYKRFISTLNQINCSALAQ